MSESVWYCNQNISMFTFFSSEVDATNIWTLHKYSFFGRENLRHTGPIQIRSLYYKNSWLGGGGEAGGMKRLEMLRQLH